MKSMRLVLCSMALASLLAAPTARASVPSASNSTVDPCFRMEPGGTLSFTVVVRDFANNPVVGSFIVIDYCACPEIALCESGGLRPHVALGCTIEGVSDATGTRVFKMKGGGGCSGNGIKVYADGVLLAQVNAASPDQNGDLSVDAGDAALLATKLGGTDMSGDLNCDGAVTVADQAALVLFFDHTCLTPTSTHHSTWGEVKIRYR
jgi:hypothetical protein